MFKRFSNLVPHIESGIRFYTVTPHLRTPIPEAVRTSYKILQVSTSDSDEAVQKAFTELAKRHHSPNPNDKLPSVDLDSIEKAYRTVMRSRKPEKLTTEEQELMIERIIQHTAPKHRQFLSTEMMGFISSDKQSPRRSQSTNNVIDQMVEHHVQQSIRSGEFDNLPGMGKPLDNSDENPYVDSMTNRLNRILINNGFVPDWALLGREIETLKIKLRNILAEERSRYNDEEFERNQDSWEEFLGQQSKCVEKINKKIEKFNFSVPIIQHQMGPIRIEFIAKRVCDGNEWKELRHKRLHEWSENKP